MTDFIGDVHGHADKLVILLNKLGYSLKHGSYSHSSRKVVFVGDYIDRGPKIKETLEIVKAMVDSGSAIALMGNHEYNALCFHFEKSDGGHLRKHSIKNIQQHYETLIQFKNLQSEYEKYIEWFLTLPLFYEENHFKVVHACWDEEHIKFLRSALAGNKLDTNSIHESVKKGSPLAAAIEETLKGKEIPMPPGMSFTDKDGHVREEIRIKWWEDPVTSTYKNISVEPLDQLLEEPINTSFLKTLQYYDQLEKPVFFGHYWLKGNPMLYRNNICCLDYSVAKNGFLAAYRFDREEKLDSNKFVAV